MSKTSSSLKGMTVSGIHHLVERAYREGHELQYLRELLVNGIEAGAARVEFGPEWRAVEREGVYRLMVADDGKGMSADELEAFLTTFGGGGKPIGEAHENFGVGAKTSLLPWNHEGVVVISWTTENPEGALIWLARDPATGEYGARMLKDVDGAFDATVRPFGEWARIKPDWIGDHGTVVVCLGNTGKEHTFLGKTGEGDIKAIAAYLNRRIWMPPASVEIFVQELRSQRREHWPRSLTEATSPANGGDRVDRRWNRRQVRGARYFVSEATGPQGRLADKGMLLLSDGTELDWYLWEGERPDVQSYAKKGGYLAALYKNELYDMNDHGARFRSFGITQASVRGNLTLIARPPMTDGTYGVYPDTARNGLKVQGTKRAGEPLPWDEWAEEFARNLPDPICEALAKAGPSNSGTLKDPDWKQRLVDRFSRLWKTLRYVADPRGTLRIVPDQAIGLGGGTHAEGTGPGPGEGGKPGDLGDQDGVPSFSNRTHMRGITPARPVATRGGLPAYDWTTMANTDEDGVYPVAWYKETKDHPNGVVQIARDFRLFVEVKKYWRDQYPDHLGAQVDQVIEEVYGESMVARIAHSEQLVHDPAWGKPKVEELRSQPALTAALLGLFSEDCVIGTRLRGLGVRRRAAA